MKKQKKFCPYCGGSLLHKLEDEKLRDYCPRCDVFYYENPLPVVSSIVVNDAREVLLVKRKNEPYKGMWCLPIGFAEAGEAMRDAAIRELKEEAGVQGEAVRLIDVDTVENYFYGSLAIVTYEVRITAGTVSPGDDAADARYYPIIELPELAWPSNEKAIKIYMDLNRDIWAMLDSYRQLYPEVNSMDMLSQVTGGQKQFLSNVVGRMLSRYDREMSLKWKDEVNYKIPKLKKYLDLLIPINEKMLSAVQNHLQGMDIKPVLFDFIDTGQELKKQRLPLPELITALALSRKLIWELVIDHSILASPLEIYTALELNNRIIFLYDRFIYSLSKGYCE
jgi:8-oxo-dGTP diphosphatase